MVENLVTKTSSEPDLIVKEPIALVADPKWATGSPWWGGGRYEVRLLNVTSEPIKVTEFSCTVPIDWVEVRDGNTKFSSLMYSDGVVTGRIKDDNWASLVPAEGEQVYVLECSWPGNEPSGLPADLKFDDKPVTFDYPGTPSKPTGIEVTLAMGRSLHLSWRPSEDPGAIIGYNVEVVRQDFPGPSTPVATRVTKAIAGGLTPKTAYKIRVQARNAAQRLSGWSEVLVANSGETNGERPPWDVPVMPFIDYAGITTTIPGPPPNYMQITPIAEATNIRGVSLGFITMTEASTEPTWGAFRDLKALDGSHNKSDVESFVKLGGTSVISMGGWNNHIPEMIVHDEQMVFDWYKAILDAYQVKRVDFDIEGNAQEDQPFLARHLRIVSRLLMERPDLRISYTLPVDGGREQRPQQVDGPDHSDDTSDPTPELTPTGGYVAGFNIKGKAFLRMLATYGITPSLVNGMVMTMGNHGRPQGEEAKITLRYMHRDLMLRFRHLTEAEAWSRIGACPMYGINDGGERFTLDDMRNLVQFATEKQIGSVGGWSANRDWHSNVPAEGCGIDKGPIFNCTWMDQQPGDFLKIAAEFTK